MSYVHICPKCTDVFQFPSKEPHDCPNCRIQLISIDRTDAEWDALTATQKESIKIGVYFNSSRTPFNGTPLIHFYCPYCGSDEFLIHPPAEWQCKNCGKYINEAYKKQYDKYLKQGFYEELELPKLEQMIADSNAKPIMTIISNVRQWNARCRIVIYQKDDGSYIVALTRYFEGIEYELSSARVRYNHRDKDLKYGTHRSPLLLISDERPALNYTPPQSKKNERRRVVSGYREEQVFSGAFVGGVGGGSSYTALRPQYETIGGDYAIVGDFYELQWFHEAFGILTISYVACFLHTSNIENRYLPYIKKWAGKPERDVNFYYVEAENGESIPTAYVEGLVKDFGDFFARIWKDFFNGDLFIPDSDYYKKACELSQSYEYRNLYKAAQMFSLLGTYEDSFLLTETCKHKMEQIPLASRSRDVNKDIEGVNISETANNTTKSNSEMDERKVSNSSRGCYVATAVYGSYDCPQVWTLRRYRDYTLAETWYGRAFIRTYYAISPTIVKWFGKAEWFKNMWKPKLDRMVKELNEKGVADTPYQDREW